MRLTLAWSTITLAVAIGMLVAAIGGSVLWEYIHGHRDFVIYGISATRSGDLPEPDFHTTIGSIVCVAAGIALVLLGVGLHLLYRQREHIAMEACRASGVELTVD